MFLLFCNAYLKPQVVSIGSETFKRHRGSAITPKTANFLQMITAMMIPGPAQSCMFDNSFHVTKYFEG
jgi:hypothetical protein